MRGCKLGLGRMPFLATAMLSLIAAACGGGGSGGSGDAGGFRGAYRAFDIVARYDEDPMVDSPLITVGWGTAQADGLSSFTDVFTQNDVGSVGPGDSGTIGFVLAPDRTLTLDAAGSPFAMGCLSGDDRLAITATHVSGPLPYVLALVQAWKSTASVASLSGAWRQIAFGGGTFGSPVFGTVKQVQFDGAGSWSTTGGFVNAEGAVTSIGSGAATAYTVAADGAVHLTATGIPPAPAFEGALLEGGDLLLASGSSTGGYPPEILAFVKSAAAATVATFTGTYCVVGLDYEYGAAHDFRSFTGTAVSDGAGNVTFTGTTSLDGTVSAVGPFGGTSAATYAVDPDGTLSFSANSGIITGAVSADGRFAILGGGSNAGSRPTFYVLLRK